MNAWAIEDDRFLVMFYDTVGPVVGHDIGRSKTATANRVRKLRATGAWEHLRAAMASEAEYNLLMHGRSEFARDYHAATVEALSEDAA